jgi:hypothetical protein
MEEQVADGTIQIMFESPGVYSRRIGTKEAVMRLFAPMQIELVRQVLLRTDRVTREG